MARYLAGRAEHPQLNARFQQLLLLERARTLNSHQLRVTFLEHKPEKQMYCIATLTDMIRSILDTPIDRIVSRAHFLPNLLVDHSSGLVQAIDRFCNVHSKLHYT